MDAGDLCAGSGSSDYKIPGQIPSAQWPGDQEVTGEMWSLRGQPCPAQPCPALPSRELSSLIPAAACSSSDMRAMFDYVVQYIAHSMYVVRAY